VQLFYHHVRLYLRAAASCQGVSDSFGRLTFSALAPSTRNINNLHEYIPVEDQKARPPTDYEVTSARKIFNRHAPGAFSVTNTTRRRQ